MSRTRKRIPYDPSKTYDRRATELPRVGRFVVCEVDDPFEEGAKIVAIRSIRNDPLADLHSRRHIDSAQYEGGRAFQRDFEAAERGPRAIDPSKEAVDGGQLPEPITEAQRHAANALAKAFRQLGADGSALMHDFLIDARTMADIAARRGMVGQRWNDYFGLRVRECLHSLAFVYGFAKETTGKQRIGTTTRSG
jgi:hypothetical protein